MTNKSSSLLLLGFFAHLVRVQGHTSLTLPVQFKQNHGFAIGGASSPRALLGSSDFSVDGGVSVGYYYANITLGTPARQFTVIVDSGSALLYIPCIGCKHCGSHQDAPFDSASSATFKSLACSSLQCSLYCGRTCCAQAQTLETCRYGVNYAEHSSINGDIVEDTFWLGDSSVPVVFGCQTHETGAIYSQRADGIIGLAASPLSIQSQLARHGALDEEFTLCFGMAGGGLVLGSIPPPLLSGLANPLHVPRTRVAPGNVYYNVVLTGLSLGDATVHVDSSKFEASYGTIVDSGTTFTWLPTDAVAVFNAAFNAAVQAAGYTSLGAVQAGPCFRGASGSSAAAFAGSMPNMTLAFSHSSISLLPKSYIYLNRAAPSAQDAVWCSAIADNGPSGALLGAVTMRDVAATYDNRVGQEELRLRPVASCNDFAAAARAGGEEEHSSDSGAHAANDQLPVMPLADGAPGAPDAQGTDAPGAQALGATDRADSDDSIQLVAPTAAASSSGGSTVQEGAQRDDGPFIGDESLSPQGASDSRGTPTEAAGSGGQHGAAQDPLSQAGAADSSGRTGDAHQASSAAEEAIDDLQPSDGAPASSAVQQPAATGSLERPGQQARAAQMGSFWDAARRVKGHWVTAVAGVVALLAFALVGCWRRSRRRAKFELRDDAYLGGPTGGDQQKLLGGLPVSHAGGPSTSDRHAPGGHAVEMATRVLEHGSRMAAPSPRRSTLEGQRAGDPLLPPSSVAAWAASPFSTTRSGREGIEQVAA